MRNSDRDFKQLKVRKDKRELLITLLEIAEEKCLDKRELGAVIRIRDLKKGLMNYE